MSEVIRLDGVTKNYRRGRETIRAVNSVALKIEAGEFVAIVGPSGSGKTTLLNLLGCVEKPDAGSVHIDNADASAANEKELTNIRARKIGFVFQQFFLLPTLTARENVLLPSVFLRNGTAEGRADELLGQVGLRDRAEHLPVQLSGGEMQRVAIARALINNPRILLADEPTGSLDSENAAAILEIFADLNRAGLTIVMVTHNPELAAKARRIVTLRDGHAIDGAGVSR